MTLISAVIYAIAFIGGLLGIYYWDIKALWQDERIKFGLALEGDVLIPDRKTESMWTDKKFFANTCNKMIIVSFLISGVIVLAHMMLNTMPDKANIQNVIIFCCNLFLQYVSFMTLSALGKASDGATDITENKEIIKKIAFILYQWKVSMVKKRVVQEKMLKEKYISDKINEWAKCHYDKNGINFAVLVLRIKEDYLYKLLPQGLKAELKDEFRDLKLDIVELYIRDVNTLHDELINFFNSAVEDKKLKVLEVLEFLQNADVLHGRYDNIAQIDKKIRGTNDRRNEPKKNLRELDLEKLNCNKFKNYSHNYTYKVDAENIGL